MTDFSREEVATTADKKWTWWAGYRSAVEEDGRYDIDNASTRDEVIASALRETMLGDQFYVIEAVMDEWVDDGDDVQPFAETRNRELLTNGPAVRQHLIGTGEGGRDGR